MEVFSIQLSAVSPHLPKAGRCGAPTINRTEQHRFLNGRCEDQTRPRSLALLGMTPENKSQYQQVLRFAQDKESSRQRGVLNADC
jgi:hypothetical protein